MNGIGILLLRAGSKGLVHKNRALLGGRHLFLHTLQFMISDARVAHVVVSTNDQIIANLCAGLDSVLVRNRPEHLSGDLVTSESALIDALAWYENQNLVKPEFVLYCQATEPLRPQGLLERCLNEYYESDCDSVFAAFEYHKNFWVMDGNQLIRLTDKSTSGTPRQSKPPVYREDTGICLVTHPDVIRSGRRVGDRPTCVVYDHIGSLVDIHDESGLKLAEALLRLEAEL